MTDKIEELARWMREQRQARGWSTSALADIARKFAAERGDPIRLSQQTISSFEQGTAKREPHWIKYVRQAFAQSNDFEPQDTFVRSDQSVFVEALPTLAGMGGFAGTGDGDANQVSFSRYLVEGELKAQPGDLLAVEVEGSSMEPDFFSGDQLLVDKRKTTLAQPGAFCLWDGDGYVVKYLEKVPGSDPPQVRVIARNTVFSTYDRMLAEIHILGRVVWFGRRV